MGRKDSAIMDNEEDELQRRQSEEMEEEERAADIYFGSEDEITRALYALCDQERQTKRLIQILRLLGRHDISAEDIQALSSWWESNKKAFCKRPGEK